MIPPTTKPRFLLGVWYWEEGTTQYLRLVVYLRSPSFGLDPILVTGSLNTRFSPRTLSTDSVPNLLKWIFSPRSPSHYLFPHIRPYFPSIFSQKNTLQLILSVLAARCLSMISWSGGSADEPTSTAPAWIALNCIFEILLNSIWRTPPQIEIKLKEPNIWPCLINFHRSDSQTPFSGFASLISGLCALE